MFWGFGFVFLLLLGFVWCLLGVVLLLFCLSGGAVGWLFCCVVVFTVGALSLGSLSFVVLVSFKR